MWDLVETTLMFGCLYTLIVISTWITSILLRYDDLSLEAAFGFGGALQARLFLYGFSPITSLIIVLITGPCVGAFTGFLHLFLGLNNVLTGIIVVSIFFSINMFIGTVNMSVIQYKNIFSMLPGVATSTATLLILFSIALAILIFTSWLLTTQIGLLMRATGSNPLLVTHLGKSPRRYFFFSLMLAHMFTALAGALFVQHTGYYSISSNIGILVIALTGLMIARSLSKRLGIELLIGSCAYQAIIAFTLHLQIDPNWSRFITAFLLIALISLQRKSDAHSQQY